MDKFGRDIKVTKILRQMCGFASCPRAIYEFAYETGIYNRISYTRFETELRKAIKLGQIVERPDNRLRLNPERERMKPSYTVINWGDEVN